MSVPFVQAIEEASPSLTCTCTHVSYSLNSLRGLYRGLYRGLLSGLLGGY